LDSQQRHLAKRPEGIESKVRQDYKGQVIEVSSLPLRDGGYTIHFFLERHDKDIEVTHFESGLRFDTRKPWMPESKSASTGLTLATKRRPERGEWIDAST
jgi:hypothetical protein